MYTTSGTIASIAEIIDKSSKQKLLFFYTVFNKRQEGRLQHGSSAVCPILAFSNYSYSERGISYIISAHRKTGEISSIFCHPDHAAQVRVVFMLTLMILTKIP